MGKGRDKKKKVQKKSNAGVKKKAHNQGQREELNEQKRERREERKAKGGDDDIQALLAQVALQDKKIKSSEVLADVKPPSPRCNCTYTAIGNHLLVGAGGHASSKSGSGGKNDVLLYGGEYFDGKKTYVYGDLYKFDVKKRTWSQIKTKKPPKPRSGHQSFAHKGYFYTFGGEYTSPNQKNFNHYRDLWRLDLSTWEWEQLSLKGSSPSARSGHRICVVKGKAVLFGGFYDTGRDLKYYNDLWVFDIESLKWASLGSPGQHCPSPRSGFQLFSDEISQKVYLLGGYSKRLDEKGEEHGVTHDDLWCLDVPTWTWERVKKQGIAPVKRAGSTVVTHKRGAVAFGGVVDHEVENGEALVSEFFNDLFSFRMDNRRWFPMVVRPPGSKGGPGIMGQTLVVRKHGSKEDAAATRIQAHFRGYKTYKAYKAYKTYKITGGSKGVQELLYSPALIKGASQAKIVHPCPRIKASMVVLDNVLWLYGGSFEDKDIEITLDDLWCINLNKLDGWTLVERGTWKDEQYLESSSDEDEDMSLSGDFSDMSDMSEDSEDDDGDS